jgi:thiamine biosynthesis lipoprotein
VNVRIFRALCLLLAGGAVGYFACRAKPQTVRTVALAGSTMGTTYAVKLSDPPRNVALETLQADLDRRLERLNDLMSTYRKDSELSRFNRHRDDDWFAVSEETVEVATAALAISRLTDGAFDVTVGPLVNLWNFGPDPQPDRFPTEAEIDRERQRVGYRRLEVRQNPPALRKTHPDLQLDFSAIAKGYAVDVLARRLTALGVTGFMVEIGGEIRTQGRKPDGQPWRIGIEKPIPGKRSVREVVALSGESLAVSGDYRNFFEKDGRRYAHGIDPHTGRPVEHNLASVSVIADECMTADAWATALLIVGPDAALRLAREQTLDVLLILRTKEAFEERMTAGFKKFLQAER